ncbi:hypothetical protein [Nocardiopsis rhodophaea]|uniref:hypothetical protein n=1 Tax=Nocardiopsis rhodophaea TaxID=280238 RepID=UPI0031D54738
MTEIRDAYEPALAELPGGGSDIASQLRLGSEWISQLGKDYRLNLVLFTDGFHNIGHKPGDEALSQAQAEALAAETSVPELAGASVTVAGLGRVAEDAPESAVVEGLTFYYEALCTQTGADTCTAVTDYAMGR